MQIREVRPNARVRVRTDAVSAGLVSGDRDTGGSGLGLAIVAEAVQAHGGTEVVRDNRPGARFEVRLPPGTEDDGRPGTARVQTPDAAGPTSPFS